MIGLLRKLIREELGRDLKSPRPDPLTWKSYPNIHVEIYPFAVDGTYTAKVTVDDRDDLTTPMRKFKSEQDATFWARDNADRAYKSLLNTPGYDPNKQQFK
jgi:hypothetical protein